MRTRSGVLAVALPLAAALLASACSSSSSSSTAGGSRRPPPRQLPRSRPSGPRTSTPTSSRRSAVSTCRPSSIMSNPNTDPHTFEASPAVAREITAAKLIVQNGVGYDNWATTIENADPSGGRKVINVQQLLGLPDSTPNPHLWYKPTTMPKVASAIAADLGQIDPAHAVLLQGQRRLVHRQPERVDQRHRGVQVRPPGHPGRHHGAGGRLHAPGRGRGQPDALDVPGRHHERHRPLTAEHGARRTPCSPSTRSRCSCTTSRSPTR